MSPAYRVGQSWSEFGLAGQVLTKMREAKRDVPRFVLCGKPGHCRGDGIRRIPLDEPQQRQERALAKDREQERCDGELWLVDECLEGVCPLALIRQVLRLRRARRVNTSMCRASSAA
jgi:hypothetical protein